MQEESDGEGDEQGSGEDEDDLDHVEEEVANLVECKLAATKALNTPAMVKVEHGHSFKKQKTVAEQFADTIREECMAREHSMQQLIAAKQDGYLLKHKTVLE